MYTCCYDGIGNDLEIINGCNIDGTECNRNDVADTSITTNLQGIYDVKFSHNADYLFSSVRSNGTLPNRIVVWEWDTVSQELSFVSQVLGGVDTGPFILDNVGYIALSPETNYLAAASYEEMSLSLFSFNPTTGTLAFDSVIYDNKSPNGESTGAPTANGLDGIVNMVFYVSDDPAATPKIFTACEDGSELGTFEVAASGGLLFLENRRTQRTGLDLPGCFDADGTFIKQRNPTGLAVDSVNGRLYAGFSGNDVLAVYNILDESPYLECHHVVNTPSAPLVEHQVALGDPDWVGFVDGFVYVIGGRLAIITVFKPSDDPASAYGVGTLDFVQQETETTLPVLERPVYGTVSNDGCTMYVAQTRGNPILIFSRDSSTGILTYLSPLEFDNGLYTALSVAVHPFGDVFVPITDLDLSDQSSGLHIHKDSCPDIGFTQSSYDDLNIPENQHDNLRVEQNDMFTIPNMFAFVLSGMLFVALVVGLFSSISTFLKASPDERTCAHDVESHWSSRSYSSHAYGPAPVLLEEQASLGEITSLTGGAEGNDSYYQSQEEAALSIFGREKEAKCEDSACK